MIRVQLAFIVRSDHGLTTDGGGGRRHLLLRRSSSLGVVLRPDNVLDADESHDGDEDDDQGSDDDDDDSESGTKLEQSAFGQSGSAVFDFGELFVRFFRRERLRIEI